MEATLTQSAEKLITEAVQDLDGSCYGQLMRLLKGQRGEIDADIAMELIDKVRKVCLLEQ